MRRVDDPSAPGRIDLDPFAQIDLDPGMRAERPAAERRPRHDPRRQAQRARQRDVKLRVLETIRLARRQRLYGVALDLFPRQIPVRPFADLARDDAAVGVAACDLFCERDYARVFRIDAGGRVEEGREFGWRRAMWS